jgi:hypothetical protein
MIFKAYRQANLRYGVCLMEQQDSSFSQPDGPDQFIGGKSSDRFYFPVHGAQIGD